MKYVLERMLAMGYITPQEHQQALRAKIEPRQLEDVFRKKVPYFAGEAKRYIKRKYGKRKLQEGGLRIFTTVDVEKQMQARRSLRDGLKRLDLRQGYRGPLGHIARKHWKVALRRAAAYYRDKTIKPGRRYAGLVLSVNHRRQYAVVQLGSLQGKLPLAGMRWARTPNPSRYFLRNLRKRIGKVIRPGDWILVEPVKHWKKLRTKVRYVDRKIPRKGQLFRLAQHPKVEGAILSMDPHSGYVQVLVGGYSYHRSEFNRAMFACRQPGSSFKPVVYTTAIEVGEERKKDKQKIRVPITVSTILIDAPLVHDSNSDPNAARYKPRNYSGRYEGEVTVRTALTNSMNIPAIKLLLKVGIDKVTEYARKFGITTNLRKELGLALGQSCVRPWELYQVYGMIARGGLKVKPTLVKLVLDRDGNVLEDNRSFDDPGLSAEGRLNRLEAALFRKEKRLISRETAYLMTYLLRQVVRAGTGIRATRLKRPAAGKTGTTNDAFDVWFMGMTPRLVTGVWMGFDKNEKPLGPWETGGKTALPVWLKYMKAATQGETWGEWRPPPTIVWKRVHSKTGKLANVDTRHVVRVPFKKGTEPQQMMEKRGRANAENFYKNY